MNLRDPQTQKGLLGGIVVLGLAYAFHEYLYKPRQIEIGELETQAARLESYNAQAKTAAQGNRIATLEEESVGFARRLEAFEELIPTTEQVPELLAQLATAALVSDVDLLSFTPLPAEPASFYTEQFYEVEVRGGYHALGQFVTRVANLPRIVTLNSMNLVAGKDNLLGLEAIAKTFRYLDPEEVAAQKKAKADSKGGAK